MATKLIPPQVKQQALQLYFEGKHLPVIAKELGLPAGTIRGMRHREHWAKRRVQMRAELLADWKERIVSAMKKEAVYLFARHLQICGEFCSCIEARIRAKTGPIPPDELRTLAQALAAEYRVFEKVFRTVLPPDTPVPDPTLIH